MMLLKLSRSVYMS